MIKLKQILNENPDFIYHDNVELGYEDFEPIIVFGYKDNKMLVSPVPHPEMVRFYKYIDYCETHNKLSLDKAATYFDTKISPSDTFYEGDDYEGDGRYNFKYAGRIWLESNIVSFWTYPKKNEIKKVLDDISKEYNKIQKYIKSFPSAIFENDNKKYRVWPKTINLINNKKLKIEVLIKKDEIDYNANFNNIDDDKGSFISVDKYIGSEERSKEDLATQHVISPLLKKKRDVMAGWGSKFDKTKTLNPYTNPKLKYGDTRAYWGDSYVPSLKLKQILLESPHLIKATNLKRGYSTYHNDARAFGWYKGKFLTDNNSYISHHDLIRKFGIIYNEASKSVDILDYPGRIWLNDSVMSFWEYPTKKKYFNEIIKYFNLNINKTKIQVFYDKNDTIQLKKDNVEKAILDAEYDETTNDYLSWLLPLNEFIEKYCD